MMTEIYPSNARLIQHININIIHNSNKGQKPHDHRHKVFNKTQYVFKTKKTPQQPRDQKEIPQANNRHL